MSKRLSNPPPAEATQAPENIIVSSTSLHASHMKAALRTPRPILEADDVLFRVELALSRLENGDYGYCVRCNEPISIEKLENDPSAVICDGCRKPNT